MPCWSTTLFQTVGWLSVKFVRTLLVPRGWVIPVSIILDVPFSGQHQHQHQHQQRQLTSYSELVGLRASYLNPASTYGFFLPIFVHLFGKTFRNRPRQLRNAESPWTNRWIAMKFVRIWLQVLKMCPKLWFTTKYICRNDILITITSILYSFFLLIY